MYQLFITLVIMKLVLQGADNSLKILSLKIIFAFCCYPRNNKILNLFSKYLLESEYKESHSFNMMGKFCYFYLLKL